MIYRASRDGWRVKDFHAKCDAKGTTVTLIKCKSGRVCGGFTRVPWSSPSFTGCFKYDPQAFVFSVDYRNRFAPKDSLQAVWHHHACGPNFGGGALRVFKDPMDMDGAGGSYLNSPAEGSYQIPPDSDGNSVLTGEGRHTFSCFTCAEIEVYRIKYAKPPANS